MNLSLFGNILRSGKQININTLDDVTKYHLQGYECAIAGENPYMDEIDVPDIFYLPSDTVNQNLMDYIRGYLWSIIDKHVLNFLSAGTRVIAVQDQSGIESMDNQQKEIRSKPTTLEEIFNDAGTYRECMELLRTVNRPVISDDNKYLLGPNQKGAFAAWYKYVRDNNYLKPGITVKIIVRLLNQEIIGLNLGGDGSTLYRHQTTQAKHYSLLFPKMRL